MSGRLRSRSGGSHPRGYRLAVVVLLALAASMPASAAAVVYKAVDLPDINTGLDHWRYDYRIAGAFTAFDTLTLEFAPGLYEGLDVSTPPAVLLAQPVVVGLPGTSSLLMLTATTDLPSHLDTASVSFVWLGSGSPGAQAFSVVSDAGTILQDGMAAQDVPLAVPEPASLALLLAASVSGALVRRRGRVESSRSPQPHH